MADLKLLQQLCAENMAIVDATLHEQMASQALLIPQLSKHLVDAGGKRIRPLLLIGAAEHCGYHGSRSAHLAAAVEFIHTATLLHDDVVDESNQRRGKASANSLWGNKASVLVGDFLFSRAFELMVKDGSLKVLATLSKASAVIAEGEVLQLAVTGNLATNIDGYLKVVKAKTAALFAAACEVGAAIATEEGHTDKTQALRHFGETLGIIFQIRDDVRDYTQVPGKETGNDFFEQKMTAPVIYAYQHGDATQQEFWQRTIGKGQFTEGDFEQSKQYIKQHNALQQCQALAQQYYNQVDTTGVSPALKAALDNAMHFTIED